jgi:zinc protease
VRATVAKHWGGWKRGEYKADVPVEPPRRGRANHRLAFPTLPWIAMGFTAPAYSDTDKEYAALDLIGSIAFRDSDLYKKLVINEQKVDAIVRRSTRAVDPYLFTIDGAHQERWRHGIGAKPTC